MNRKAYPTDLTDQEGNLLKDLLPAAKAGGRPRSVDLREVLNVIFYRLRTGIVYTGFGVAQYKKAAATSSGHLGPKL